LKNLRKTVFKDAFIFKHTAGNKTLYRVRVGKIKRSETNNLANKLKELKFINSVQVTRF
jgi:Sporulation related domain.